MRFPRALFEPRERSLSERRYEVAVVVGRVAIIALPFICVLIAFGPLQAALPLIAVALTYSFIRGVRSSLPLASRFRAVTNSDHRSGCLLCDRDPRVHRRGSGVQRERGSSHCSWDSGVSNCLRSVGRATQASGPRSDGRQVPGGGRAHPRSHERRQLTVVTCGVSRRWLTHRKWPAALSAARSCSHTTPGLGRSY